MIIDGNNFIAHHLKNNITFTAGKIGLTELKILYYYLYNNKTVDNDSLQEGYINSGIYPITPETIDYFCKIYIESVKNLDLAPQWCGILKEFQRDLYQQLNPKCYNTQLGDLEPYYFEKPWTKYLEGKRVLVVSPFAKSIEKQHKKLNLIWNNKITSNFEIDTIKFPFSAGLTTNSMYSSYRECLEKTIDQISNKQFDFCILGVGAYSLPLCNHIKKMGKSSLHLGGATQVLFGIRGDRWDSINRVKDMYNDYWVTPDSSEIPEKYKLMEGGCYW